MKGIAVEKLRQSKSDPKHIFAVIRKDVLRFHFDEIAAT